MKSEAMRAIREKCMDCMGNGPGARRLVDQCTSEDCPLYPFRKGEAAIRRNAERTDGQTTLFEISA